MGLKSKEPELYYLLLKNKIIAYKKKKDVQCHIAASTCHIPECLKGYQPAERPVKKINQCKNKMSHVLYAREDIYLKSTRKELLSEKTF
jgi:hypothetical protein